MYEFEHICVCKKFFVHFAKFCVLIFWNACLCSLIAFWVVRDFGPIFGPGTTLNICVCV